jgi:predicted small metal-binding protein
MSEKKSTDTPTAGSNPNVQSSGGGINPSAPSAGTAGWGTAPDEKRKQVGQNNPEASSPEAQGAGDLRHSSYPQNEAAQNPAASEPRTHGNRSFHCTDESCDWSVTGNTEEEILGYMRAHSREAHAKSEFTPQEMENARRSIHKRVA